MERVQVDRPIAPHRDVEIASGSRLALGGRAEQDNQFDGRFHPFQVGETLDHVFLGDRRHGASLSGRI